jgi:hypothetical protein
MMILRWIEEEWSAISAGKARQSTIPDIHATTLTGSGTFLDRVLAALFSLGNLAPLVFICKEQL